jgi:hypothetical protein
VFYGQVLPDGTGEFPIRVRAVADSGVVCGTGTVQVERTRASYAIRVATAGLRDGCPGDGEPVNLVLLYGLIDEGGPAASRITIFAGEVAELSLARPAALSY